MGPVINQARRLVNNELDSARRKLETHERASTALASTEIRQEPLKIKVCVYAFDDSFGSDEKTFDLEVNDLKGVWEFLSKHMETEKAKPDDVDIIYQPSNDNYGYWFASEDIEAAYNRFKGY